MSNEVIDLRSDAISVPGQEMRDAIATADVGDEQKREDPTVLDLERRAADMLGQDESVFVPSATMANQIALRVLTRPGDEVLVEERSHIFRNEAGGPAVHSGLVIGPIPSARGIFTGDQVRSYITRDGDPHHAQTAAVCVENTHNSSGGSVWSLDEFGDVSATARELGLAIHLDGARLLNAAVASDATAATYAEPCDTVTLCFSKGLGCPAGAVIAGSSVRMASARRFKHLFGGAMRQTGFLAAAGLYALDHNVDRLAEDHANARRFARGLVAGGVRVVNSEVESNIVLLDVRSCGLDQQGAIKLFRDAGVLISKSAHDGVVRVMTHIGVEADQVDEALRRVIAALGKMAPTREEAPS